MCRLAESIDYYNNGVLTTERGIKSIIMSSQTWHRMGNGCRRLVGARVSGLAI